MESTIIPEKESRRGEAWTVRSTVQGARMSSDNEDKTDPENGVSSLNRAGRACGNTRTTRGCLHPTRKAMREIREGEGPSWGLRL